MFRGHPVPSSSSKPLSQLFSIGMEQEGPYQPAEQEQDHILLFFTQLLQ